MESNLGFSVPDALLERLADLIAARLPSACQSSSSPYLDVDEAAAYLRCDDRRIYDLRASGRLACVRDGRRLLFTREALDRCLSADPSAEVGSGNGFAGRPSAAQAGGR
jgi:excisionase family DNA binding protein